MDAELKQHLEAMEARIMERVGGRIDASEERLKDFIRAADRDMETKIIGEFLEMGKHLRYPNPAGKWIQPAPSMTDCSTRKTGYRSLSEEDSHHGKRRDVAPARFRCGGKPAGSRAYRIAAPPACRADTPSDIR